MYQGRPRPVGDVLFGEPTYYDHLPTEGGYRQLYGADLAYSEKTRADWSVLLGGQLHGPLLYLTSCLRRQVQADKFTDLMAGVIGSKPGQVLWYGATTERGTAQLIRRKIPSFQFRRAIGDKYVRALPTADRLWNQGRILVPSGAPWVDTFLHVMSEFTGQNDVQDDEDDALAALGDLVLRSDRPRGLADLNRLVRARMQGSVRSI
jgi:phage terminase large subunit-like protein